MDTNAPPELAPGPPNHNTLDQIAWEGFYKVARELRITLPKPGDAGNAALVERDRAAIAMIASLVPVTSAEANAAAHHIILSDIAMGCLRDSQDPALSSDKQLQSFKWADSLLRQSNAKLALLLRMQAERRRREATPKGAMQCDYAERHVTYLMASTLGCIEPTRPPGPPPEPEPEPEPEPPPPEEPKLTEGEFYAARYPTRAKAIREYGGMPPHERFGPPTAKIIKELLTSTSPRILAVDDA